MIYSPVEWGGGCLKQLLETKNDPDASYFKTFGLFYPTLCAYKFLSISDARPSFCPLAGLCSILTSPPSAVLPDLPEQETEH